VNVVASTRGLKSDRLTGIRLSIIERTSPKISARYSILAKVKAISQEEYTYQRLLLLTTEQQGSLFAQIPGQVVGNVHPVTNSNETVVGYFSAQETKTLRYFINPVTELPEGFYIKQIPFGCQPEPSCGFPAANPADLNGCVYPSAISDAAGIVAYAENGGVPYAYIWVYGECSDCTMKGGTTKKPSFW